MPNYVYLGLYLGENHIKIKIYHNFSIAQNNKNKGN